MEKIVKYLLFVLFLILTITVSYNYGKINKLKEVIEYIELEQNTTQETFNHTLTSVIFDTVYQNKYIPYYEIDTVILNDTITNIITDTLYIKDTIQLPNQVGIVDSTFTDTVNNQIINNQLYIQLSGYKPTIDTLKLNISITSIKQKPKWYSNLVPAVGIGVGINGKIGVFAGIGYKLQ